MPYRRTPLCRIGHCRCAPAPTHGAGLFLSQLHGAEQEVHGSSQRWTQRLGPGLPLVSFQRKTLPMGARHPPLVHVLNRHAFADLWQFPARWWRCVGSSARARSGVLPRLPVHKVEGAAALHIPSLIFCPSNAAGPHLCSIPATCQAERRWLPSTRLAVPDVESNRRVEGFPVSRSCQSSMRNQNQLLKHP